MTTILPKAEKQLQELALRQAKGLAPVSPLQVKRDQEFEQFMAEVFKEAEVSDEYKKRMTKNHFATNILPHLTLPERQTLELFYGLNGKKPLQYRTDVARHLKKSNERVRQYMFEAKWHLIRLIQIDEKKPEHLSVALSRPPFAPQKSIGRLGLPVEVLRTFHPVKTMGQLDEMIQQVESSQKSLPPGLAKKDYDFAKRVIAFYREPLDALKLPPHVQTAWNRDTARTLGQLEEDLQAIAQGFESCPYSIAEDRLKLTQQRLEAYKRERLGNPPV